jgi:hypothetical protein
MSIDPQLRDHAPSAASARELRQFAALWLVVFTGLACWQALGRDRLDIGAIHAVLGAAVGVTGLVRPGAIRPIFRAAMAIVSPIGWVVSHAVLALLFFGILTPLALLFRLAGRDVLHRRARPSQDSHWAPLPQPDHARHYLNQY